VHAHEEFLDALFQDVLDLHRSLDLDIFFAPWRMNSRPTRRIDEYSILYGDPDGEDWSIHKFDPDSRTYNISSSANPTPTFEEVATAIRSVISSVGKEDTPGIDPFFQRVINECSDEFVVAGSSGMKIPMAAGWLEAVAMEPGLVADYLDIVLDKQLRWIEIQHKAGIRLINGGGDFAFNSGPIYSPAFFHEVMFLRWKKLFDACRKRGMYYVMRSDGNLWPVADDLFGKAMPHAYYEVDYDAGMHFDEIRKRFPELVLIGNVSCDLLRRGAVEQIRQMALECIEAAAPRVILASSNAILHGTPAENVFALYETIRET
jgi:hypothetical protein